MVRPLSLPNTYYPPSFLFRCIGSKRAIQMIRRNPQHLADQRDRILTRVAHHKRVLLASVYRIQGVHESE